MARSGWAVCVSVGAILFSAVAAVADVVDITGMKDNTLYEDPAGSRSNGAGESLVVGRTQEFENFLRRGLVAFDIAGNVPADATINSVSLTLQVTMVAPLYPASTAVHLHPVLADWGEGSSNADFPAGTGAGAQTGDATWLHTFFDTGLWTTAGGDFGASSASQSVTGVGSFSWSSAQMVADVQGWLDNPASNFGWAIIGLESTEATAMLIASRDASVDAPVLHVDFTPIPEPMTLALLALGAPAVLVLRRRRETVA